MQKNIFSSIFKWCTVALLASSAIFFFLPYIGDLNPLEAIKMANEYNQSDYVVEGILRFVVPVVFTLISAFIMIFRISIPKCAIATVCNLIATSMYFFYVFDYSSVQIGLTMNVVIAVVGILLPIINIILFKVLNKAKKAE